MSFLCLSDKETAKRTFEPIDMGLKKIKKIKLFGKIPRINEKSLI